MSGSPFDGGGDKREKRAAEMCASFSPYAGFFARFVALMIDVTLLGFVSFCAALVFFVLLGASAFLPLGVPLFWPMLLDNGAGFAFSILLPWLYFALLESSARQGTPGKRAMGLVVTDLSGARISFRAASVRYFAKYLSAILLLGFLLAAFTEKRQALHDLIADTLVVKRG